jgi:hypothetical protein
MSIRNIETIKFLGSKVRRVRRADNLASVSQLSWQCGILNISQPYRLPRPVTGIALLFFIHWDVLKSVSLCVYGLFNVAVSSSAIYRRVDWKACGTKRPWLRWYYSGIYMEVPKNFTKLAWDYPLWNRFEPRNFLIWSKNATPIPPWLSMCKSLKSVL